MIWLAWRQVRTHAAIAGAVLVLASIALAVTGTRLAGLDHGDAARFLGQLADSDGMLYYASAVLVYVTPAVLGVFWGAPLVTRELEGGTHRLVWNQAVTRSRWLAGKLALTGVLAMVVSGLVSLAVSWWADPIDTAAATGGTEQFVARIQPVIFGARGIVPVGYAAFAFVLGVAVGLLVRRTVPAMAITLAVFAAVQLTVPVAVRGHLIPPVTRKSVLTTANVDSFQSHGGHGPIAVTIRTPPSAWVLSNETVDAHGRAVVGLPVWAKDCVPPLPPHPPLSERAMRSCYRRLADHGYRQRVTYQPVSRFWEFQWVETAAFLGLSLLLAGVCFRLTRRDLA